MSVSLLDLYGADLRRCPPPMTAEEEAQAAREGDLDRLVMANLKFAIGIALKFQGCGLSRMDLISAANLGIVEAARRYRPDLKKTNGRPHKFISYAVHWIVRRIHEALSNETRLIALPVNAQADQRHLWSAWNSLTQAQGDTPNFDTVAAHSGISPKRAVAAFAHGQKSLSLHSVLEDSDRPLLETVADDTVPPPDEAAASSELKERIQAALSHLPERLALIVSLRYGLGGRPTHTLREVGALLGLSRERVRQLQNRACRMIKFQLVEETLAAQ